MKINGKNTGLEFSRSRRFFWFFFALIVIFALLTFRYERFAAKRHFGDFHVYYVTGERFLSGVPIYVEREETLTPFKYTPLAASWFALLALLPEPAAAVLWHLFNLGFLAISAWLILRMMTENRGNRPPPGFWGKFFTVFLAVLGISPAILHGLNSGQVGFAILFFFILGAWFSFKKKDAAAGFFFGLSAMFKFMPLLVLPYFLFRRRYRLSVFTAAWFLTFLFAPSLWMGWKENAACLGNIVPFLSSTALDHVSLLDFKNQSAWAYLYRLFFYDLGFFSIREQPEWLAASGSAFFIVLYGTVLLTRAGGTFQKKEWLVDLASLAILTVMFNPNAWKHNFVMLFFPYLLLIDEARGERWASWKAAAAVLIALLFFASNRTLIGWDARFELMSFSVLFLASFCLFLSLVLSKRQLPNLV